MMFLEIVISFGFSTPKLGFALRWVDLFEDHFETVPLGKSRHLFGECSVSALVGGEIGGGPVSLRGR